jgi:hypothetical protein
VYRDNNDGRSASLKALERKFDTEITAEHGFKIAVERAFLREM